MHLNLGNPTSLDEVLMVIQGMDPRFNYVLIRDPQVASDYATFPPMSVSNVTLKQIFDVIHAAFPMVDITTEDGPKTTLFLFNIKPDRLANNTTQPTSTTVYPLAETLDYLASRMPGKAQMNRPTRCSRQCKPRWTTVTYPRPTALKFIPIRSC